MNKIILSLRTTFATYCHILERCCINGGVQYVTIKNVVKMNSVVNQWRYRLHECRQMIGLHIQNLINIFLVRVINYQYGMQRIIFGVVHLFNVCAITMQSLITKTITVTDYTIRYSVQNVMIKMTFKAIF